MNRPPFVPPPRRTAAELEAKFREVNSEYAVWVARDHAHRDPEIFGILQGALDTVSLAKAGAPASAKLFHDIRKEASPTPYQRGVLNMLAWLGVGRPFRSEQEIAAKLDAIDEALREGVETDRHFDLSNWRSALSWALGDSLGSGICTDSDAVMKARAGDACDSDHEPDYEDTDGIFRVDGR